VLLVFKLKWEGEQAAMGSSQVMKLRRPAQDFARHFYRLNVEATVFRNGNESDRFLAHDHLTAVDDRKLMLGNDEQRINRDEAFLFPFEPVEQLLAGQGPRIFGDTLVARTKERIKEHGIVIPVVNLVGISILGLPLAKARNTP